MGFYRYFSSVRSLSDLGNCSDMYRMYGSRTPTVGALGDAAAVTEIYPKSDRLLGWTDPLQDQYLSPRNNVNPLIFVSLSLFNFVTEQSKQ